MWKGHTKPQFLILEMLMKSSFIVGLLCLFVLQKYLAQRNTRTPNPPCGESGLYFLELCIVYHWPYS